jgi:hypothetical protein
MDMMLWPFFVVVLDGVDVPHHVAHVGVFYAVFCVLCILIVASADYIKLVIDVT